MARGREAVEYVSGFGMASGIYGLLLATVCIAVAFVLSLEVARVHKVYDYRKFFQVLLAGVAGSSMKFCWCCFSC